MSKNPLSSVSERLQANHYDASGHPLFRDILSLRVELRAALDRAEWEDVHESQIVALRERLAEVERLHQSGQRFEALF